MYNVPSIESQIFAFDIQQSAKQNLDNSVQCVCIKLWHFIKLNNIDHK